MAALNCKCRKGARCLACIEKDGLTKPKQQEAAPPNGWWGLALCVIVWGGVFLILYFNVHA